MFSGAKIFSVQRQAGQRKNQLSFSLNELQAFEMRPNAR
jgi:hypothetical protein